MTHPLISANICIFLRKSATFVLSKIRIQIAFEYIISEVFKGCVNKHGSHFDHMCKISYSRILKSRYFEIKFMTS